MPPDIDKSIGDEKTMAPALGSGSGGSDSGYTLDPGHILGQYKIIRVLGHGGMGEVYEAENAVSRKHVALKVLPKAATGGLPAGQAGSFIDRFRIESRVMSDLRHDNIVQVHHAGCEDGLYYLTMDLVLGDDGEPYSLEDVLTGGDRGRMARGVRGGRGEGTPGSKSGAGITPALSESETRKYALRILDALEYAHARNVVHRDLKPANVLMEPHSASSASPRALDRASFTPRITDFGLAKVVGNEYLQSVIERSISLSMAGAVSLGDEDTEGSGLGGRKPSSSARALLGTYDYMAPEQKTGGEITVRTDIYAFGIMLYRMLTGRKPEGRAKPVSHYGVSKSWDAIVDKCLENDPSDRYATVTELKRDIAKVGRGRRTRRVVPLAVAALFVAAAFGGLHVWRAFEDDAEPVHTEVQDERGISDEMADETIETPDPIEDPAPPLPAIGAADVLPLKLEAEGKWRAVGLLKSDPGLGAAIDEVRERIESAAAYYNERKYDEAKSAYREAIAVCDTALALDAARQAATGQRDQSVRAKRRAEDENASENAATLWREAETLSGNAQKRFDAGDFPVAEQGWRQAATRYDEAETAAIAARRERDLADEQKPESEEARRIQEGEDREAWQDIFRGHPVLLRGGIIQDPDGGSLHAPRWSTRGTYLAALARHPLQGREVVRVFNILHDPDHEGLRFQQVEPVGGLPAVCLDQSVDWIDDHRFIFARLLSETSSQAVYVGRVELENGQLRWSARKLWPVADKLGSLHLMPRVMDPAASPFTYLFIRSDNIGEDLQDSLKQNVFLDTAVYRSPGGVRFGDADGLFPAWNQATRRLVTVRDNQTRVAIFDENGRLIHEFGEDGRQYGVPSWSPDGKYLKYVEKLPNGDQRLCIYQVFDVSTGRPLPMESGKTFWRLESVRISREIASQWSLPNQWIKTRMDDEYCFAYLRQDGFNLRVHVWHPARGQQPLDAEIPQLSRQDRISSPDDLSFPSDPAAGRWMAVSARGRGAVNVIAVYQYSVNVGNVFMTGDHAP